MSVTKGLAATVVALTASVGVPSVLNGLPPFAIVAAPVELSKSTPPLASDITPPSVSVEPPVSFSVLPAVAPVVLIVAALSRRFFVPSIAAAVSGV